MRKIMKTPVVALVLSLLFIFPALSYAARGDHDNTANGDRSNAAHGDRSHAWQGGHNDAGRGGHKNSGHRDYSRFNLDWYVPFGGYYGNYYVSDGVLISPPVYQPVVVNDAAAIQADPTTTMEEGPFTVNIPDDRGGYVGVVIKRSGNGFTGPQGEFYPEFPKISVLKVMYVK